MPAAAPAVPARIWRTADIIDLQTALSVTENHADDPHAGDQAAAASEAQLLAGIAAGLMNPLSFAVGTTAAAATAASATAAPTLSGRPCAGGHAGSNCWQQGGQLLVRSLPTMLLYDEAGEWVVSRS